MAIRVNGEPHPWKPGLTVERLLQEKKYTHPLITIVVNGKRIPPDQFASLKIVDQDRVEVIHMMTGG